MLTGAGCGPRRYQGEVWLRANVSSVYMDKLYFEMTTTADLQLDNSPFGPVLAATYKGLAGAPNYLFFQAYDTLAKRVTIAAYPALTRPQRVVLSTTQAKPFFRFQFTVSDTLPAGRPATASFTPLATANSLTLTTYFRIANPLGDQLYYPHHFTALLPAAPAVVQRPKPFGITRMQASRTTIAAGVGTKLTIYGAGFGARRVNPRDTTQQGAVQFVNADNGTGTYLPGLDRIDYRVGTGTAETWTDTLITVLIPSRATKRGPTQRQDTTFTVGRGPVRVLTFCGVKTQSRDTLDIRYNITNVAVAGKKWRGYLAGADCSRGRVFTLDAQVANLPGAKATIEAALRAWSAALGVPLTLAKQVRTGYLAASVKSGSVIFLDSSLSNGGGTLMRTSSFGQLAFNTTTTTNATPTTRRGIRKADIGINPNQNWAYDSTSTAALTGVDFYAAVLHEIGHSLGLSHVTEQKDIMFYRTSAYRRTLTTGRGSSLLGAKVQVAEAKKITNWGSATTMKENQMVTLGQPIPNCGTQNRQANPNLAAAPDAKLGPVLYPNPFAGETQLLLPPAPSGPLEYTVLDACGRALVRRQLPAAAGPLPLGAGLPNGLYLVRLLLAGQETTLRMVKID